jgi:hypothetical protein
MLEDEGESTRSRRGGQLPKFGAIEENGRAIFRHEAAIKKIYKDHGFSHAGCGFFGSFELGKRNC